MSFTPFTGTFPMLYAFFDSHGALRGDAFAPQVDAAVAAGAAGVAVLGLASEAAKLGRDERRSALRQVIGASAGRLPVVATISETNMPDMIDSARDAAGAGAAWLILQPPRPPCGEADLVAWFAAVAESVDCPMAIQNAPEFLGIGLGPDGLVRLAERAPRIRAVKAECSALDAAVLVERLQGRLAVLNGRAGLELTDNARAGVSGMIPGIETVDLQAACLAAMQAGREAEAEALYRRFLPTTAFIMQGIARLVLYGKIIAAHRLGLDAGTPRLPSETATPAGLAWAARLANELSPLPT